MKFRLLLTSSIILLFIIALTTSAPTGYRSSTANGETKELSSPLQRDTSVATASSTCPPKPSCYEDWRHLYMDVEGHHDVMNLVSRTKLPYKFLKALNHSDLQNNDDFEEASNHISFNELMKITFSGHFVKNMDDLVNQKIEVSDWYCGSKSKVLDLFNCMGKKLENLLSTVDRDKENGAEKSVLVIGSVKSFITRNYRRLHIFVKAVEEDTPEKVIKCTIMYFVESEKEESEKEEFKKIMEPYVKELKVCKETKFRGIGHFKKQKNSSSTNLEMMSKLHLAFLEEVSPTDYEKINVNWLWNFKRNIARSSFRNDGIFTPVCNFLRDPGPCCVYGFLGCYYNAYGRG